MRVFSVWFGGRWRRRARQDSFLASVACPCSHLEQLVDELNLLPEYP